MTGLNTNICHQKIIKDQNLKTDLKRFGLTYEESKFLTIADFNFEPVPKSNTKRRKEIKEFIETHEYLGKLPSRPTEAYVATYKDKIAGAIVTGTPYAFSNLLGKENQHLEKLIARGATSAISPINLGSWLIMKSINHMVNNTNYRVFSGYCDPSAKEIGTIYSSCNFLYLGNNYGTKHLYYDPNNPQRGTFSDRLFRRVGSYKRYARALNIPWQPEWNTKWTMNWDKIPADNVKLLKAEAKIYEESCIKKETPRKHKYCYIKGRSKKETKKLRELFKIHNPKLVQPDGTLGLPYPKIRGA